MLVVWLRARRAPKVAVDAVVRTPLRVNLGDLDIYRHVNNGTYLTIADLGRYDLMLRSGLWSPLGRRGWYPVVVNSTTTYRTSLKLGDRFVLETRFVGADEKSVYLEHRFVKDGQIYAKTLIRGRFVGRDGTLPTARVIEAVPMLERLPEMVPEWAAEWVENTKLPASRADAPSVWEGEAPHA